MSLEASFGPATTPGVKRRIWQSALDELGWAVLSERTDAWQPDPHDPGGFVVEVGGERLSLGESDDDPPGYRVRADVDGVWEDRLRIRFAHKGTRLVYGGDPADLAATVALCRECLPRVRSHGIIPPDERWSP